MEEVRDRVFSEGERVETDGRNFVGCTFEKASLAYGGGVHPTFEECSFSDEVGWLFTDAGLRTVQLLQMINNSDGGKAFIDDLFLPGKYIGE
jgi:hypothetical protein